MIIRRAAAISLIIRFGWKLIAPLAAPMRRKIFLPAKESL
jgi:hypothetical protein